MKPILKNLGLLIIFSLLLFSCRTEDMEIVEAPPEDTFGVNSTIANLLKRTATNDGSYDNIIDGASCFNIQLPVTVIANGIEVVIENEDDIDIIEDIFDEFSDDTDTLEIIFPITIILDDYTRVVVNSQVELNALAAQCPDENSGDDDIECIDIQYPITASIFNQNNELIDTVVINSDEELLDFLDDIDEGTIVTFDFPFTVILWDGTTIEINNFVELQSVIESAIDQCDEDDNNDHNDDDCNNCTTQQLDDILTGCNDWMVDKLERNDNDLEDTYVGYLFNFETNGTLSVDNGSESFSGTWESSGEGNNITVTINIPNLPDFNDSWNLHEIEQQAGESQVDLRIGDDRLRFESDCTSGGGVDDTELVAALANGDWYITYFFDDTDETADFADYVFNYATNGTATATDSDGTTDGSWFTSLGDETELELNINFGVIDPLDELAEDWDVLEVTNEIIRLKDRSGDGSTDFLTFERDPFTGGGGTTDLENFLTDGTWLVFSYVDDGDDETGDYVGYDVTFNTNGTIVA
ncbi:MAG: hypothetical protein JKY22_01630, partial [Flavobacteriaceae bacterium]|nr:hypothetical protein [Flavobacteriaceae bacterium]